VASFTGFVRRIDLEPKQDFLGARTYAHVFLRNGPSPEDEIDVYTDDPRFEAVLLAAYTRSATRATQVEVHYEESEPQGVKKITRVILDMEFGNRRR
jgi:hypothetical protein